MERRRLVPLAAAVVAVASLATACGAGASIREPPAQFTTSMESLEEAVRAGDGYAVEAYAYEVAEALMVFRDTPGVPLPMRVDLDQLSFEVAGFGARASGGWLDSKDWISLHSRINRVASGEAPTAGPRYQSDFSPAVVDAVNEIDAALAADDVETATEALATLNGAFWAWLGDAPPQVAQNAYEVAEEIDSLSYSAGGLSVAQLTGLWDAIRSRLRV